MEISISDFADKLNEIMPMIIKEFFKREPDEIFKGKITMPQFFILDFLSRYGESRMTDISRFMSVSTAAVTGIVDRLVKCGYAVRIFDPDDRRIIKIKPTFKAAELVKKISLQKRQMVINTFGKITQRERESYLKILMRIRDVLTKEKAA